MFFVFFLELYSSSSYNKGRVVFAILRYVTKITVLPAGSARYFTADCLWSWEVYGSMAENIELLANGTLNALNKAWKNLKNFLNLMQNLKIQKSFNFHFRFRNRNWNWTSIFSWGFEKFEKKLFIWYIFSFPFPE